MINSLVAELKLNSKAASWLRDRLRDLKIVSDDVNFNGMSTCDHSTQMT